MLVRTMQVFAERVTYNYLAKRLMHQVSINWGGNHIAKQLQVHNISPPPYNATHAPA